MSMLKEFKDWISKGNLIEAAIGLVLALAFVPVMESIVKGLIMPILAAIGGKPNFDNLSFTVNNAEFKWGAVITQIVTFVIIGFVLFLVWKALLKIMKANEAAPDPQVELLKSIDEKIGNLR